MARAIDPPAFEDGAWLWGETHIRDERRAEAVKAARRALLAIREPTPAMLTAYQDATLNQWATVEGWRKGFAAVIDHIAGADPPADIAQRIL